MKLTRQQISGSVAEHGWRLILGTVQTHVLTESLAVGAQFAARVAEIPRADGHVALDLRDDRVIVTVRTRDEDWVLPEDIELAREITSLAAAFGLPVQVAGEPRAPQTIEIGIDALDIPAVLPFWKAVLGYVQQGSNALVDPLLSGPAVWFQQMDAPRPQRNRIHFDVVVPHEEAPARIDATIAAGGKLVYVDEAPAFWVLADPEGNEACVCTWQGRDA
jgi:4a-hydroxytetrahydrobiopterin dehydratase